MAAIGLTAMGVTACGTSGALETGDSTPGVVNWEWKLPTSWDPVTSSAGWDVHVLSLVYSAVTGLDSKGNAVPTGVARSWDYSDGGRAITFVLRPDLHFSDGTALDADAVKASLLRGRDDPQSTVASSLAEITGIDVVSPTELTLHLSKADYQIPTLLAGKTGMVVSPTAFTKHAASLATKPVGDGPFTMTQYVPDAYADLQKNPGYFDAGAIELKRMSVQSITDPEQIMTALAAGQVNLAVIPGNLAKAAQAAGFRVQSVPAETVNTIDVKTTVAPFDNPKVMAAINYAIDREALVKTQEFGYGTPAYQPFPKGYVGYDPALANLYPHSTAKAQQLLRQAGYTKPLPITLTTYSSQGTPEQLQAQLDAAGFKVTIDVIPADQATQIGYIQKQPSFFLDSTAGRESPLQMLQVLYDKTGLMNLTARAPVATTDAFAALRTVPLTSPQYASTLRHAVDVPVRSLTSPHIWLYSYPRLLVSTKKLSGLPLDLVAQRFEGVRVAP